VTDDDKIISIALLITSMIRERRQVESAIKRAGLDYISATER